MSTPEVVVKVQKTETIQAEMKELHNRIANRAYEIYLQRGSSIGRDLDDWLDAEQELVWRPAVEILEKDNQFIIQVAIAGIEPGDFTVRLSEEHLLIKSEQMHTHTSGALFTCASLGLVRFSGSSISQRESTQPRSTLPIGTGYYGSRLRLRKRKLLAPQHRFLRCSTSR